MTKALLDQGLPRTAAGLLRKIGWDVQHVSERGMSQADNDDGFEYSRSVDLTPGLRHQNGAIRFMRH